MSAKPVLHPEIAYTEEVRNAVLEGAPLVALESTIISHGMPWPTNVETAMLCEKTVRDHGAVPATLAIIKGKIHAGLDREQLEMLARAEDVVKASRRDIGVVFAKKLTAATTVASTMICADLAGIRVFATGGIGGVHRGAQQSFDISADLQEMARTDVAVVCAGAKSILDLPLTMEYLETMGVPVLGFQTRELPAFYTRTSGIEVDAAVADAAEAAAVINAKWRTGLHGGVLIVNPIPEDAAMPKELIDGVIQQALDEAEEKGIKGKEVTPFLLQRVTELTGGESLQANISLVVNNARVAAGIAAALNRCQ